MSVNSVVYCNLCPLKEFCPHADDHNAYLWSREKYNEATDPNPEHIDLGSLQRATALCPLREVLVNFV